MSNGGLYITKRDGKQEAFSLEKIKVAISKAFLASGFYEQYYTVAKNYILYRQKHTEDREIREKIDFLSNYCNASNAATGSKYDANANVEKKNIATLIGELPKSSFIRINRRLLTDRIKEVYGKELADRYLYLLNNHFIYKAQQPLHLQERRDFAGQLLRLHHHVSLAQRRHGFYRRQQHRPHQAAFFLRRVH